MHLQFRLLRPTSLPKRVTEHIKKPDISNLVKAVEDALRNIFYRDDSQIVLLIAKKVYALTPGVRIRVMETLDP